MSHSNNFLKDKLNYDYSHMDESYSHHDEGKKPNVKVYLQYESIFIEFKNIRSLTFYPVGL
jgi:hypothetical protein